MRELFRIVEQTKRPIAQVARGWDGDAVDGGESHFAKVPDLRRWG